MALQPKEPFVYVTRKDIAHHHCWYFFYVLEQLKLGPKGLLITINWYELIMRHGRK